MIQVQNLMILIDDAIIPKDSFHRMALPRSRDSRYNISSVQEFPRSNTKQGISFPETLLDTSRGNSSNSDVRIQFIAYNIGSFFQDPEIADHVPSPIVLAGRVDPQMNIMQLVDPVIIRFPQFQWKVRDIKSFQLWSKSPYICDYN